MKPISTLLTDVILIEPSVFGDERGFFMESYNQARMKEMGISQPFVQDNHSRSSKNVLRGLHYQTPHVQGKLVRVIIGEIFDVAVDLRKSSPTFGKWDGAILSAENKRMLWVPEGLAHGFQVLSDTAEVLYKTTDFYHPECEKTIIWNDPDLNIAWKSIGSPVVSAKDASGVPFSQAPKFD